MPLDLFGRRNPQEFGETWGNLCPSLFSRQGKLKTCPNTKASSYVDRLIWLWKSFSAGKSLSDLESWIPNTNWIVKEKCDSVSGASTNFLQFSILEPIQILLFLRYLLALFNFLWNILIEKYKNYKNMDLEKFKTMSKHSNLCQN